jgi:carbon-monoxide dehydrogenase large subunit
MTSGPEKRDPLSVLDRPNSYIGKIVPRPNLDRLMQGRGLYVSDIELPRMVHVVFLRSPYAHAKIMGIDASAAKRMPGVVAVVTGQELAAVIKPSQPWSLVAALPPKMPRSIFWSNTGSSRP